MMGYQEQLARARAAFDELIAALQDLDYGLELGRLGMTGSTLRDIDRELERDICNFRADSERRWKERKVGDA